MISAQQNYHAMFRHTVKTGKPGSDGCIVTRTYLSYLSYILYIHKYEYDVFMDVLYVVLHVLESVEGEGEGTGGGREENGSSSDFVKRPFQPTSSNEASSVCSVYTSCACY